MKKCYSLNGDNMNYININGVDVRYIKQEDGTRWYALTDIVKKILFKDQNPQAINNKIKDETKVKIFYEDEYRSRSGKGLAYIEHEALKEMLPGIYTKLSDYNASIKENAVYKLYSFLNGVEPMESLYAHIYPSGQVYSSWEMLCFKTDPEVSGGILWKKCLTCNKYYPNSMFYFVSSGYDTLACQCLQCAGYELFSQSYDMQALKYYKRLDLARYILSNDAPGLYNEFIEKPFPIALEIFKNADNIINIIYRLEQKSRIINNVSYSLATISHVTNVPKITLTKLLKEKGFNNVSEVFIKSATTVKTEDLPKMQQNKINSIQAIRKQKKRMSSAKHNHIQSREREAARLKKIENIRSWAKKNKIDNIPGSAFNDERILSLFVKDDTVYIIRIDDGKPKTKLKTKNIMVRTSSHMSVNKQFENLNKLLDK